MLNVWIRCVEVDGNNFTLEDFEYLQRLSEIIDHDEQLREEKLPCDFGLANLKITITNLKTYEKELIVCK